MAGAEFSTFDEKSGVIEAKTPWGRWWQTVYEVNIEVNLPPNTRAKDVKITIKPTYLECVIKGETLFKGTLFGTIRSDDNVWTIEDGGILSILLSRADHAIKESVWSSLFTDGSYPLDPLELHETQKKLDLEHFQVENPGMDFSNAMLDKRYDKVPE